MKKILFLLLLITAGSARADQTSSALLKKLSDRFSGYSSYAITFSVNVRNEYGDYQSVLTAKGSKYHVQIYDYDVFFDGKTQYTYSRSRNEVVIEEPDAHTATDFLSNPSRLFFVYDEQFNHRYEGTIADDGKSFDVVEIVPKRGDGNEKILLYLDKANGNPVRIVYFINGVKESETTIREIRSNVQAPDSLFRFDRSKYPGVEIIDFR